MIDPRGAAADGTNAERWAAAQAHFHAALERPTAERAAFVARAVPDLLLRALVSALLEADAKPLEILSVSPTDLAASVAPTLHDLGGGTLAGRAPIFAVGERIGPYEVLRELGRGGMGAVYLVRDEATATQVALKVLRPDLAMALAPERFQREIRLASRLRHPHLLAVLDSGETNGRLWLTMPFIDGETLRERLRREQQLPVADAVRIACEVAGALSYIHDLGIVHRDVKPENVLLDADSRAVLTDFGISRVIDAAEKDPRDPVTAVGSLIGTPVYMSPEQTSGERVDGRSDVYGLGCVFFEMLTGTPPFGGDSMLALRARWIAQPPPSAREARADLPRAVDAWVSRALAPNRLQRPTSVVLVDVLRDLLRDLSKVPS